MADAANSPHASIEGMEEGTNLQVPARVFKGQINRLA